ncbi:hypothetical protein CCMA1212_008155 [Trichoderma ghanense]|uniref:Uncharacterized protein n=1 Tax=Trichoderma ghanense TaxID=65468 RepID=A0ABY2GVS0_9HYPO
MTGFAYNPAKTPVNSWKALCAFKSWSNQPDRHPPKQKAWRRYQDALAKEVELYFGDVDDITAWKTVCRAVGCEDPPDQISQCKAILKKTHVNIVDLVDWAKKGGEESGRKVKVFASVAQLRNYTHQTGKIFRRSQTRDANGRNVVLKFLLRPKTPLDIFFSSFKGFTPKGTKPPSELWKTLVKHNKWPVNDNNDPAKKEAWKAYQKALLQEVELYFGNEDDPKAWRTLCRAVGRADAPEDIKKCEAVGVLVSQHPCYWLVRQILRNTHVNIVDLINWGRKGGEGAEDNEAPEVFKSVEELKSYTYRTRKIFEQEQLREYSGGNVVLRHLLRRLFSRCGMLRNAGKVNGSVLFRACTLPNSFSSCRNAAAPRY